MPRFMAEWATMLLDHYRYTGDSKRLSELYPNLVRVMTSLGGFADSEGLLNNVPGFVFLDWTPDLMSNQMGREGELTGMNCHYYRGLSDAAELAGVVLDEAKQSEWRRKAGDGQPAMNERLWSRERGPYA